ncbi:MAG: DUF1501 domain-containing protein [Actinobacteria bacterium]|nr:DUF1501 domain-containing protein [Actinomycetota bacterium]
MDTLTRRRFIHLTGAGAMAAAAHTLSLEEIANAAIARPLPLGTPILVVVTLYGGNDGLNTVVPFQDPIYHSLRPQLAYKENEVIPIGQGLALNGSMTGFKSIWDRGQLAIVRGVGYPDPDRSHFSSMAIWQSASLSAVKSGWLGRWVETQKEDPLLAISLGSVLPPLLAGNKRSGSVLPLGGLKLPSGSLASDCAKLSMESSQDDLLQASVARSMRNLFQVADEVTPILKDPAPPASDLPVAVGGNAGGDSNLSAQLEVVAKLIAAGSPTRVWSVSSEFGRRVRANASQGTDHGTSGPVFIMGEKVAGGFYGDQPSLANLKEDDLQVTTDFRDIYATLLERVLNSPKERVIPNWKSSISDLIKS